jgi:DNA-binding PadR family transcriptional regulator
MMKENKTAYAILGMLSHEAMTGYDLKKRIESSLSFFWNAGFGQIYPALTLLESQGYVTKATEVAEKRPKRIIYSITSQGLDELKSWLAAAVEKEDVKYEILLKLFFGRLSTVEKNIGIIDEFNSRNSQSLAVLQGFKANLEQVMNESEDHLYFYLTVLFGEKIFNAYLEWSSEAVEILRSSNHLADKKKDNYEIGDSQHETPKA